MSNFTFDNQGLNLYVLVTMTNWDEPPRMRHEISSLLSKEDNVLFVQLHAQRRFKRKRLKYGSNVIVERIGISFPGVTRLFWRISHFRKIYYKYTSLLISKRLKKLGFKKIILINFQYDYPEIFDLKIWDAKIYFCNDDFIGQQVGQSEHVRAIKEDVQKKVALKADMVVTVSEPLKKYLSNFSDNVKLIFSGHRFDILKSMSALPFERDADPIIKACYLGVLNQGVALDWLEFILDKKDIFLTIIGPLPYSLRNRLEVCRNFKNINFLTGELLQNLLLEQDVLLMPYSSRVANDMTSVPAKLFQYLAVGKPIVSSVMPNLIELPDKFVYMASDKYDFYNLIHESISESDQALAQQRIELAARNTWAARGVELKQYIKGVLN